MLLKHNDAAASAREFSTKLVTATGAPVRLIQLWRSSAASLRNYLIQQRQLLAREVDTPASVAAEVLSASAHSDLSQFYALVRVIVERCRLLLKIRVAAAEEDTVCSFFFIIINFS